MVFDGAPERRPAEAGFAESVDRTWPGLDPTFHQRATLAVASGFGEHFQKRLARDLTRVRGKISPLGPPLLVQRTYGARLRRFVGAYHRCVEAVIGAWSQHEAVRRVVALPPEFSELVRSADVPSSARLHLCRLDLLLRSNGGFNVVETNANCPGGLLSTGYASRRWRTQLSAAGLEPPPPLEHEAPLWMGQWFMHTAEAETGEAPDFVVLLRWDGGNRLGLPGLAEELTELGVEAAEADPRELDGDGNGCLSLRGRPVRHAYWKLGLQDFRRALVDCGALVSALSRRRVFVQNGMAGRFVGDNKLCLAVLSDPTFASLFDAEDLELLRPHVPWSRNIAQCGQERLRRIRERPAEYVLKRPLDTRGRGVVMGREATDVRAWERAVGTAVQGRWLVQEFCTTSSLETPAAGAPRIHNHDLSVGVVDGRLVGALSRSSSELRTNVALTGCLHPVFVDG